MSDYATSDLFTTAERVALELAEAMTLTPPEVADDLYERLTHHFSESQIVELAAMIAFENLRARFNRVFGVEANDLYCPLPVPVQST